MGERIILSGTRIFGIWKRKQKISSKTARFTTARDRIGDQSAYNLLKRIHFHFTLIVMVLFVILAGYVIIYNIFLIYP